MRICGFLLFLASLLILRVQFAVDLNLDLTQSMALKIHLGFLYDLAIALFPSAIAWLLLGAARIPWRVSWSLFSFGVWITTLANVLYFRFFRGILDLWIVQLHWKELFLVKGSVGNLAASWPVMASSVLFLMSVMLNFWARKTSPRRVRTVAEHARAVALGVLILVSGLALRQSPVWFNVVNFNYQDHGRGTVFDNQILVYWWNQFFTEAKAEAKTPETSNQEFASKNPGLTLANYRDYPKVQRTSDDKLDYPLFSVRTPSAATTQKLRKRLGLPQEGKINVLILFLESVRAFEFDHPVIGPQIFPELRDVLAQHGIVYTQAYSSVNEAGQTVRGQFSTLCSMLPNIGGPAPYISHSALRIECLMNLFRNSGYSTAWLNSFDKNFHNKGPFEIIHGTEHFYDRDYFGKQGITQKTGSWGLADAPFLQESIRVLERLADQGKPFFAHILTISSHHPPKAIPGVALPEPLVRATEGLPDYQAQLSQFRYVDMAVGRFFQQFFKSPLSNNTVVLLMADHATALPTYLPLTPIQNVELQVRIPMALITKKMPKPTRIDTPVHQLDVAPTLADIAGEKGPTTWLGRNMLEGPGTPWVCQTGDGIHYRTSEKACYSISTDHQPHCYETLKDPLFSPALKEVPVKTSEADFFRSVIRAQKQIITTDRIAPN